MGTHFSSDAMKFLRGLKRNNDRDWFAERKPIYERELKEPLLALIGEVNDAMVDFAPQHVRPPQKIAMRIYRDIRFSKDKRPYKNNVAGWWARDGLQKTSGAGFYFHINTAEVMVAAGVYMPEREQLLAIRRYLVDHHKEFRAVLAAKKLRSLMQESDAARLTRPPKGFSADDPAIDLLMCRQWGVSATLPLETAMDATLGKKIIERFKAAAPMVEMLNAPLLVKPKRPMF
ncbi:DUF2461 domain-containing protein [Granulicella sp. L60]|uniref:DUF2461 domain-containing protein n=1 Tax=Granulicella sp. L60 TaxID=1641866 RepID=UPI00131DDA51|nr:DUF2461 domain-containing protein [Granulicella sp. L60]